MPHAKVRLSLQILLAGLGIVVFAGAARAQKRSNLPPIDRSAVYKTHVPHINPHLPGLTKPASPGNGNGHNGGGSSGGGGTCSPSGIFTCTQYTVGANTTATDTQPEAEEEIAADPSDGNNLVAAISDFSLRGGYNTTKYAWSSDNGSTWSDAYVPLDGATSEPITGDGLIWQANSDPVVAFDDQGHVYMSNLYLSVDNSGNVSGTGLYVSEADWSGAFGFSQAHTYTVASHYGSLAVEEDKPWITVDDTRLSGGCRPVYATWTRFVSNTDYIVFSRSLNCGVSWSTTPVQISDPGFNGAVQGSQVVVGPPTGSSTPGVIYVAYEVYLVGGQGVQFVTMSADGGSTWSASYEASPVFKQLSYNSTYRKNSFASLAVSPSNNYVYMVYADQPSSRSGAHIEFLWSSDSGVTFSTPVSINDTSSGQRLMPSVVTDAVGTVHTSWFDTRNSSRKSSGMDIYAARSTDNGTTFSFNTRVTSSSFSPGSTSFIGDYAGNAAGTVANGATTYYAHPVWTNGGFSGGQLQTSALH